MRVFLRRVAVLFVVFLTAGGYVSTGRGWTSTIGSFASAADDSPIKTAFRQPKSVQVDQSDLPPAPPRDSASRRRRRRPYRTRPASYTTSTTSTRRTRSFDASVVGKSVLVEPSIELSDAPSIDIEYEGAYLDDAGCASCNDGGCQSCGRGGNCFWVCLPTIDFVQYSVGVQGFKGPANLGRDSSFGFHESVNAGVPINLLGCGVGAQFGARAVQSNLSGANPRTAEQRDQIFATAGLFRRVDCGLQFGAVIDYLNDDWDRSIDLTQIRAEISWVHPSQHELGFRFASGLDSSFDPVANADVEAVETYSLFYRARSCSGGVIRLFAGGTSESEGLAGGDLLMPFNDCWGFGANFAYLVPEFGAARSGNLQEAWNVGFGVVWQPGGRIRHTGDYYRPLFDVAHNGVFFVDR